jgi:hypothetical protein
MSEKMSTGSSPCERLKELLVDEGQEALERHAELAAHVAGCAACQRLLRAWDELPGLLGQLPEHAPDEAMVEKVRAAVAADRAAVQAGPRTSARRRFLAPALASAAILLAAVGISRELLLREAARLPAPVETRSTDGYALRGPLGAADQDIAGGRFQDEVDVIGKEKAENRPQLESIEGEEESIAPYRDDTALSRVGDDRKREVMPPAPAEPATESHRFRENQLAASTAEQKLDKKAGELSVAESPPVAQQAAESPAESLFDAEAAGNAGAKPAEEDRAARTEQNEAAQVSRDLAATLPTAQSRFAADEQAAAPAPGFDFLAHYQQTAGLAFQPATGYWANTYVPGDPAIRLLSARLAQWDRSWLENDAGLEREVRPIPQPFDAPDDNALALSLMADAAGIPAGISTQGEPTRLRLQVGIQGIEHRRGQRPAMNVGVVVDLPSDAPDTARIAARALLDALLESKQAGDRFALVLTGTESGHPGLVIEAGEFRFGTLQLARQIILGQPVTAAPPGDAAGDQAYLDLHAALQRAGALVQASEDPGRPLGSSAILLLSAGALSDLDRLTALTHAHAQAGIITSVFPLGNGPDTTPVERLVLAGLGHRRILEAPAEARRLIADELHAASRAVARAARLSIRLAPGVELIDVIGSERLDAERAERVREVEHAMDRRLAADLGIQADRGRDEEGIQIVVPAIYSGDAVTVLLDLVTDRPGAIAEVTLRYKDLVYLRNGSLSAQLELPRADAVPERGPAELAVLKNLLAHHFSEAVDRAADALGRGQAAESAAILRGMHATIEQARRDLPAWADDPDLIRDQQVLERYRAALESPQAATQQSFLADSLRLAAYAKSHGLPEEWK